MKSHVKIGDDRLDITRVFDAPRERVFDAWRRVDLVQQWWGCQNTKNVESVIDFRPGGQFSHKMQIEGCGEYEATGTFTEIVEPEKITYTTMVGAKESLVTVEFVDRGEQTELRLTQIGFEPMPGIDVQETVLTGFSAALERLAAVLRGDTTESPATVSDCQT